MAVNLTAIFPLEDLSLPGLVDVSHVKLLAALAAFPAMVVILHVLSQLVRVFRPSHLGVYLTRCLLVSASRQESPPSRFPLGAHSGFRHRLWNGSSGIL